MKDPLSTWNTDTCMVCGAQKIRAFHHEQFCPNEDYHVVATPEEPEGEFEPSVKGYTWLPTGVFYTAGQLVRVSDIDAFAMAIDTAKNNAPANVQIWRVVFGHVGDKVYAKLVRWIFTKA